MKRKLASGVLTTVDNEIDPTTGTVRLRSTFDNRDNALFPSQFVNARMLVERRHNVVLLPTAAIQRTSNNVFVFLVQNDTVAMRPITTGVSEGDNTEIISGLAPGDVVVMTGVDKLQEGSKVRVEFPGPVAVVHHLVDGGYLAATPGPVLTLTDPFPARIDLPQLLTRRGPSS